MDRRTVWEEWILGGESGGQCTQPFGQECAVKLRLVHGNKRVILLLYPQMQVLGCPEQGD